MPTSGGKTENRSQGRACAVSRHRHFVRCYAVRGSMRRIAAQAVCIAGRYLAVCRALLYYTCWWMQ